MAKNKTTFFAEATLNLHTAEAFFFVNEALFDATQEIVGFEAVERARELAPVLKEPTKERKPGELRDSIDARVNRVTSGKRTGVRARIMTHCGYGGFVELGTARTDAEPFIWPAFEQVIRQLPEAVKANLASYTTSGEGKK
jgi:HK97 gp10 family phage protein